MRIFYFFLFGFMTFKSLGQVNLGVGPSLIIENFAFGLQVKGAYEATERVAICGGYTYFFKKGTSFSVDLDAQFKIINLSTVSIAPIAGINIRRLNDNLNTALQLGFFIEIERDGLDLYFEPKAILDDNSVIVLSGGFYF